jgi:hypothetical protein
MTKRRNILFLIVIFLMLLIKAARAQQGDATSAGVDWDNSGDSIQDTWHGVATTGLVFAAVIGGLLTALRIRATRALQQSGLGGPQQLGLSQIPVQPKDERAR